MGWKHDSTKLVWKLGWYDFIQLNLSYIYGYGYDSQTVATHELGHLYNGVDHFYTTSASERDYAETLGYSLAGIATYVLDYSAPGTEPLYRLYNGTDHFYTADPNQRDYAETVGYSYKGIAAYVRYR